MNQIKLGNVNPIVWQGRDYFDQSPGQTDLSSNNLTPVGGKTTDKYLIQGSSISAFISSALAAGSVENKILVSVTASKGTGDTYNVTVESQALDYQPEAGINGSGSGSGSGSVTPTPEQEDQMDAKYGTETEPRTLSMTVQEVEVDILKTPDYINLSAIQKAAIRMYIGGASPLTKTTLSGTPQLLQAIIPQSDPLVRTAIASPTIKALNTTIEYGYWSLLEKNYTGVFPREVTASDVPGNPELPNGYTAYFLNGSSEPVEYGFRRKEIYLTGYPTFDL